MDSTMPCFSNMPEFNRMEPNAPAALHFAPQEEFRRKACLKNGPVEQSCGDRIVDTARATRGTVW